MQTLTQTEKTSSFVWNDQCQNAFDIIKHLLTIAPVLGYRLLQGQPFLLDCDASNVEIGAVTGMSMFEAKYMLCHLLNSIQ